MSVENIYEMKESQLDHIIKLSKNPMELVDYIIRIKKTKASNSTRSNRNANGYVKRMQLLEKSSKEFRSQLITNQTNSEKVFKALLKSCKINYNFQHIIYNKLNEGKSFYIVDFYLPTINCVIEIDGEYHDTKKQQYEDRVRTKILREEGITQIYRFSNKDVVNTEYCRKRLLNIVDTSTM